MKTRKVAYECGHPWNGATNHCPDCKPTHMDTRNCKNENCLDGKAGGYDKNTCSIHCHDAYENQKVDRQPTHTPTPWTVSQAELDQQARVIRYDADGISSHIAMVNENTLAPEHGGSAIANAAFIVRAVNAHEELVNLLKQAQGYIEDVQRDFALEDSGIVSDLKEAIAKAEGK